MTGGTYKSVIFVPVNDAVVPVDAMITLILDATLSCISMTIKGSYSRFNNNSKAVDKAFLEICDEMLFAIAISFAEEFELEDLSVTFEASLSDEHKFSPN